MDCPRAALFLMPKKTDASEAITFLASFPPIQAAVKVAGNGDGMRIQLDIPETEMASAVHLLTMRECVLRVTVEREQD